MRPASSKSHGLVLPQLVQLLRGGKGFAVEAFPRNSSPTSFMSQVM